MRAIIALTTAAAMLAAGIPTVPAFAQSVVAPVRLETASQNPAIAEMFKAFPGGGEALSKRIADFIVSNPKLAPDLANYVVNTPGLSKAQKVAAERGLAAALERLGIKAADLPVYKAPPAPVVVEEPFNPLWLLAAAALIGGIICAFECFKTSNNPPPVSVH